MIDSAANNFKTRGAQLVLDATFVGLAFRRRALNVTLISAVRVQSFFFADETAASRVQVTTIGDLADGLRAAQARHVLFGMPVCRHIAFGRSTHAVVKAAEIVLTLCSRTLRRRRVTQKVLRICRSNTGNFTFTVVRNTIFEAVRILITAIVNAAANRCT
jgi:hypothetical protein